MGQDRGGKHERMSLWENDFMTPDCVRLVSSDARPPEDTPEDTPGEPRKGYY